MTTAIAKHLDLPGSSSDNGSALRFWGLDVRGLHDRFWAGRGVQIVRRGSDDLDRSGPLLYLLLEPEDLVGFVLKPLVERFSWLKPKAIRMRIVDSRGESYRESVIAHDDGRLVSIRRDYRGRTVRTLRAWLTPSWRLAELWRRAPGQRQGWRDLRTALRPEQVVSVQCIGRISDATIPDEVQESLHLLQRGWKTVGEVIDGVYEYQPGVWLHETVHTPPDIRLVGPLWIGAGTKLQRGEVVVGPGGRPDVTGNGTSVRPVLWSEIHSLGWKKRIQRHLPRYRRLTKRLFDIGFSIMVLSGTVLLSPFVIMAILIEDGWPVLFVHRRQTLGGREFPCYKFRTMCHAAESLKEQLRDKNVCDGPQFFIEDDPRQLRIGRFLRRYHLDELPQFWNVLLGQMSVVGPRPSPDRENQYCPTWREARLSVRPGVTGLWQVRRSRRPQTDFQEWIRYDLEYVQRQSWQLDFWIIGQTIKRMFTG